eukprot:jgi/Tetstr1/463648/TSEL_008509.t1
MEAEMEHVINMATLKQGTRAKPPDNPRTTARVTKAGRRWLEERRAKRLERRSGRSPRLGAEWWQLTTQLESLPAITRLPNQDPVVVELLPDARLQAALVKYYAAYANEKHLGKESPTVKVTSKLINPKDSKQHHHWAISEDKKDKEGFATLTDSDSEWYAWGLDDLRAVDAEPYDFQLVDYNPVFKRQYHLAHREQEWANNWVKKLEKARIVGEIESP